MPEIQNPAYCMNADNSAFFPSFFYDIHSKPTTTQPNPHGSVQMERLGMADTP